VIESELGGPFDAAPRDTVAVLAVDPSSAHTGGALLGDRVRFSRHVGDPQVFIRSMASRRRLAAG
jgi:LAO/AO transport system kinase